MMTIPKKVEKRLKEGLKHFQPIVETNRNKDVNESDTVVMIIDILSNVFGFDKYNDITTEHAIRGAFCDIALKVNGKIQLLIEAKAIGIELKENHIRQVVDCAANEGVEWVILTNAVSWKIFKVMFSKPIQNILVSEVNIFDLKSKSDEDIQKLYILTKEAISKYSLEQYYTQKQATNKFMIGNLLCIDSIINEMKKNLRKIYPDIKIEADEIKHVLLNEVLKREILEGIEAEDAKKKIAKYLRKQEKTDMNKNIAESAPSITDEKTSDNGISLKKN